MSHIEIVITKQIILIYRRETPNNPAKRFRTTILNPFGVSISKKFFYKIHQSQVAKHHGTKVCLRRKKTRFKTKFNLYRGTYNHGICVVSSVSLALRYKTFTGVLIYSNGAMSTTPLFNGAAPGCILHTLGYIKNPKYYNFSSLSTGACIPVAYLYVTSCFFNIRYTQKYTT